MWVLGSKCGAILILLCFPAVWLRIAGSRDCAGEGYQEHSLEGLDLLVELLFCTGFTGCTTLVCYVPTAGFKEHLIESVK